MQKILFISNIAKGVGTFSIASIQAAHELDLDFYMFAKWNVTDAQIEADEQTHNVRIYNAGLDRSPYSLRNVRAFKQLVDIIRDENIDYIHCNTPVGGLLGRLAGKKCKVKKVIYQAHGFHFYKGAPRKNWLLYYPVEKWLAHYTDALITINQEDYALAKTKLKLRIGGKVYYVPGVGIDTAQYNLPAETRSGKRIELGLTENDIALISMGDLIARKNYDVSIRAVAMANNPNLHFFICGKGPDENNLRALAENLGVAKQIHFLGFRSDIKELLAAADIFLFTTKQEGLPRSMMEAMASGLPCVASRIRGNTDLLIENKGGLLCKVTDCYAFARAISVLASDTQLCRAMGVFNKNKIKEFEVSAVKEALEKIYAEVRETI